ncbi:nitroreductase family protein [Streptomyces sp. OfavH-34-F]|uniref:nitroreductase family protein n=1 Tax=Streptomyces sp. OfavH-34-F TaxID=2917760 RepID=UPI001EF2DCBF|nr:nitroreductase family protein [Streptomyces sp. OfavH-34-F]MCG7526560.1 nitroreductase family protein [Streptomyces sp. OfavH-34-F]
MQQDVHRLQKSYNGIHPLLAGRFSPYRFDPSGAVDDHALGLLLEAARWAPSAGNSQPWGFFVGRPGEPEHDRLLPHLAPSSASWAADAGLLVVTLTRRYVDDTRLTYSEFADYDLGQAIAHLTVQAQALGLAAHQFRAFDLEGLTKELDPNPGWSIVSMVAVGRAADSPSANRDRRSVGHLLSAPWSPAEQASQPGKEK